MREVIAIDNATALTQLTQVKCGWITEVIWSPDGTMLAVASATGVRLYAGQFGAQPTHQIAGHEGHVKGAAFSPDGTLLATVAADMIVKLWDLSQIDAGIPLIADLFGHDDSVDVVRFSLDGRTLATGSADGTIILWDIPARRMRARLRGHEKEVSALTFALDGSLIFSGAWDNQLRVWDTKAETEGAVFGEHMDWVREVTANPPGTMIASASKDGTVRLWDVYDSGQTYAVIEAHANGADCAAFSPDGSLLATGGRDNTVRLWSVHQLLSDGKASTRNALAALQAHDKPVLSVAFNAAGTLLATGSGDNTIRLWSVTRT